MAFVSLTDAEIAVDKPITQSLFQKVKDNFDALNGANQSINAVSNGSAEVDTDADNRPDGWTWSAYTGGSGGIYTTSPEHGAASFYMTRPTGSGNGGGTFTSDYVACSDLVTVTCEFIHWCTVAGMKNQVKLLWYNKAKVALGTASTTIYDSVANPTSATMFMRGAMPPAGALYYRVQLVGGYTDTNVANATAYFDGVSSYQMAATGVYVADASGTQVNPTIVTASLTSGTSNDPAIAVTSGPYKVIEYQCPTGGTLYSSVVCASVTTARVYVNGVAVGTAHSGSGTKTDASITVAPGDFIQMYQTSGTLNTWVIKSIGSETPLVLTYWYSE